MKYAFGLMLAVLLFAGSAIAADRASADGFAAAAAMQIAKGNVEQAKDFLYKSLANDNDCTDAVFELAKIFDKENNASAADFYQRSLILMAKDKKAGDAARKVEAEKRIKALNPYAPRLSVAVEEYATELDAIVKRTPEVTAREVATARVTELDLPSLLPPEKVPKFYASVLAEKEARDKKITTPDVERELKALGWSVVKGQFIRKGPGIYESTEGRLESTRINGRLEFILHKGSEGNVHATVRSEFGDEKDKDKEKGKRERDRNRGFGFPRQSDVEGYGLIASMKEIKQYGVDDIGRFAGKEPHSLGTKALVEAPKHHFAITASENTLEFFVDGQRESRVSSGKVSQKGPFVIDINGTVTIETPRCSQ